MEDLLMDLKVYAKNQYDLDVKFEKVDDWWVVTTSDGETVFEPNKIREAGEFQGMKMCEIILERYTDPFPEFVQASDHVIARLIYC